MALRAEKAKVCGSGRQWRAHHARIAILLIGSGKTGCWQEFYDDYIPIADQPYDMHRKELMNE